MQIEGEFNAVTSCALVAGTPDRQLFWAPYNPAEPDPVSVAEAAMEAGLIPTPNGFRQKMCPTCRVCIPARIDLQAFNEFESDSKKLRSERRRVIRLNDDLTTLFYYNLPAAAVLSDENDLKITSHTKLLARYMQARFPFKRDFNAAAELTDLSFPGFVPATLDLVDANNFLVGTCILHIADYSAYGTMLFYEPTVAQQSIGQYLILETIRTLQGEGLKYLYLADWTTLPSNLSWKDKFTPLELRPGDTWIPHTHQDIRNRREAAQAYPARRKPSLT